VARPKIAIHKRQMRASSSDRRVALAIDLGGTKIIGGLVAASREVLWIQRYPVARGAPAAVLGQLIEVIRQAQSKAPRHVLLAGIGVAVPGAVRPDGTVWAPNLAGWTRIPLADELAEATGLPVTVENDRITSLLGERWCGAARGVRNAAFVTIGTGLGVGFMVDGHLCSGARGVAGSIGWWTLGRDGRDPRRMRVGTLEAAVAGPGIVRRMAQARIPGASPQELIVAARRGNRRARAVIREVGDLLGSAVANLVSVLDPEVVILGGGIAQAGRLLLDPVVAAVRRDAQPLARSVRIVRSYLGTRASLMGAGALVYPDMVK
jgi:glucokinase